MAKDLPSSKALRAGLRAAGKIDRWDNEKRPVAKGYTPADVREYCVESPSWQRVRLSMKGKNTSEKLHILEDWWTECTDNAGLMSTTSAIDLAYACEVQVGNYLGALRRGGQLDSENRIRKAR